MNDEMRLWIMTDEGTYAVVTRDEAPELFEAFEAWQRTIPRSLREVRCWGEVIELAEKFMEDDGTPESVDSVGWER